MADKTGELAYDPPPDQSAAPDPMTQLRSDYENKLPQKKTEAELRDHWHDYMDKAKKIDPSIVLYSDQWKINFPDKYPEYKGDGTPVPQATGGGSQDGNTLLTGKK